MIESIFRFLSTPAFAQEPPRLEVLVAAIDRIMGWIFPAGVLIAVVMFIVGGYMWIVSGGDPARKQQAQGTLTWAVIGLVALFLIKAVLQAIVGTILG
jgi:magnesium-transporting ATPase (P-type)